MPSAPQGNHPGSVRHLTTSKYGFKPCNVLAYIEPLTYQVTRIYWQYCGYIGHMPREFICHRCGTANNDQAENCKFCGLQVGWRPSVPNFIRFWSWPAQLKELGGSVAAPIVVFLELTVPGTWASYVLSLPLLAASALALLWHSTTDLPDTGNPE